jgi:predicted nuclease with TOPRIM domain
MMQMNEIKQRFSQVEQAVHRAAQACEQSGSLPMDLKDRIQKLEQETNQTKQMLQQEQDENRVRQRIDQLEDLGDEMKAACERSSAPLDASVKDAVMQAHRELSDLKHQLH